MELVLIALGRKFLFIVMLLGAYLVIDKVIFSEFKTGEVIKNDPRAVATLLGMLAIAAALA